MTRVKALVLALALSCLWVMQAATVTRVTVPLAPTVGNSVWLGELTFPCEITGTLSSTTVRHVLSFQPRGGSSFQPTSVHSLFGTDAAYVVGVQQDGSLVVPELSTTEMRIPYQRGTKGMTLVVTATRAQADSRYVIRIGDCGDVRVAFDGNGGSVSPSVMTYALGQSYGSFPLAQRSGYSLKGWFTSSAGGVQISTNSIVCLGYTNLVARWTKDAAPDPVGTNDDPVVTGYSVRFNANGGDGNVVTQSFVHGEAKALTTNSFSRTNFVFSGWAESAAGAVKYQNGQVVSNLTSRAGGVVELYASWLPDPNAVETAVVDGVAWCYVVTKASTNGTGTVTILNRVRSTAATAQYQAAIDVKTAGTLTIPKILNGCWVTGIGERAFSGCTQLTGVNIPETILTIGSHAFADCTGLQTSITIPESVKSMGAAVFEHCFGLKVVRYFGDCPNVDDDLYEGTPSTLISGVLRVRDGWGSEEEIDSSSGSSDDEEYDDDDEYEEKEGGDDAPTVTRKVLPSEWPEGDNGRKIYWLTDARTYAVSFDCRGGELDDESRVRYYVPGRKLGELPEPSYSLNGNEDVGVNFVGWFTKMVGGDRVDEETVVDRNFKLYAHWRVGETEVSDWQENLYDNDGDYDLSAARVYDGYLYEEVSSNDCRVVGIVKLKVAKGKYDIEESTNATVSATVSLLGGKKLTLRGKIDETGDGELTSSKTDDALVVALTENGLTGTFGDYSVSGARNRTSSNEQLDKLFISTSLAQWSGSWTFVLRVTDASGLGSDFAADCLCAFSVTVGSGGKTKVSGQLPDGTKVSKTGTMIFGDGCACVPVLVPLYSGKTGGFSLLLWFCTDDLQPFFPWGVGGWNAERSSTPFVASWDVAAFGRAANLPSNHAIFDVEGDFSPVDVMVESSLLPDGVLVDVRDTRWNAPRADKVKFSRDEGYEIVKDNGNPSGLTLSYSPKTGVFKGSFKVRGTMENDKPKTYKASVYGVVAEEMGYGSAYIKKVGSVPVKIMPE